MAELSSFERVKNTWVSGTGYFCLVYARYSFSATLLGHGSIRSITRLRLLPQAA